MLAYRRLPMSVHHRLRFRLPRVFLRIFHPEKGSSASDFLMELEKFYLSRGVKMAGEKIQHRG